MLFQPTKNNLKKYTQMARNEDIKTAGTPYFS